MDDKEKNAAVHVPVLLQEVLEMLAVEPNDTVLDATVDGGGHSEAIVRRLGREGTLIGIDQDAELLRHALERLKFAKCRVILRESNFRNLDAVLSREDVKTVSKVLFDLGFSSEHLEHSGRGFSFIKDEPLLMTYGTNADTAAFSARDIVNTWSEEHLTDILRGYGEEHFARRIAREIVTRRKEHQIEYTKELVEAVLAATPKWYRRRRIHPATKTFQALRITVNDEVNALKDGISKAFEVMEEGARMAVITFHSIEDRIVKRTFREWKQEGKSTTLTVKPIVPSRNEIKKNPRARSAKLRVTKKL